MTVAIALPSDGPIGEHIEGMARAMEGAMPNQFKHASPILARAALAHLVGSIPRLRELLEGDARVVRTRLTAENGGTIMPIVRVRLDDDDIRLLSAFGAYRAEHPTRSPKRREIENGYGQFRFPSRFYNGRGGPRTFDRLKLLGLIEHSRNGHCWPTPLGLKALEAALMGADSAATAREATLYRHRARGTVYQVLGTGRVQSGWFLGDEEEVIVYRGEDGSLWVRPPTEFHDGRFEKVPDVG